MDLDFVSVHKHAKNELGQYPAILTSHLVNNPYLLTTEQSDLKVHALHYANELLVRVRLSIQKLSLAAQHAETIRKKCLGKELWRVLVVDKNTDHDKPDSDLFSATISTSKKMFFIESARRARAEKGIARHIDASSVVWLGPSNFWLVHSEHAHASYPGLSFRPPGFSPYMGRKESSGTGLKDLRRGLLKGNW